MLTDSTAKLDFEPEERFTYRLELFNFKKVDNTWKYVMEYVYPEPVPASVRRKRAATVTHEFRCLESNVVYKVQMTSERKIGYTLLTSDTVEVEFTTCKLL